MSSISVANLNTHILDRYLAKPTNKEKEGEEEWVSIATEQNKQQEHFLNNDNGNDDSSPFLCSPPLSPFKNNDDIAMTYREATLQKAIEESLCTGPALKQTAEPSPVAILPPPVLKSRSLSEVTPRDLLIRDLTSS